MARKVKKIFLVYGIGLLTISMVFAISGRKPQTVAGIVGLNMDEIEKCSVIENGKTGPSEDLDRRKLMNLYSLLEKASVKYIGPDSGVMRPVGSDEYMLFFKRKGAADIRISITSDGGFYYLNRKYKILEPNAILDILEGLL